MVLVNSRIKKAIVQQVIDCLPEQRFVSIVSHIVNRYVSRIHRMSDSLTPERGEMVRLNTALIGTPSGKNGPLF